MTSLGLNHLRAAVTGLLLTPLCISCTGAGGRCAATGEEDVARPGELEYARNITVDTLPRGCFKATLRNPWDTASTLATYLLVPRDSALPSPQPKGTVVRIPLQRCIVYSTVHFSLAHELGATDAVAGVCDVKYIRNPGLAAIAASGRVARCGTAQNPTVENIISARPDAIMLSPYEDQAAAAKVSALGIPVIQCADYMEPTPLGRAEWMKFYGLLWGASHRAGQLWTDTRDGYERVAALAAQCPTRPGVICDLPYNGAWWVSGAGTSWDAYLRHASGTNIAARGSKGVKGLSTEQMLSHGKEAGIWLIRYYADRDLTLASLAEECPLARQMACCRPGSVYGCNTKKVEFYEQTPFHPQWLLAELVGLLHPDLVPSAGASHRYYTPLQ